VDRSQVISERWKVVFPYNASSPTLVSHTNAGLLITVKSNHINKNNAFIPDFKFTNKLSW